MEVIPNYDLSSNHSPIIAAISKIDIYKTATPRLHFRKTNFIEHRIKIENTVNLQRSFQTLTQLLAEKKLIQDGIKFMPL